MSEKTPKSLSELIFRPGSPIGELAREAEASMALAEWLRADLTPSLSGALRSAHLGKDGTLVVVADTPAWAARLRYEGDRLLSRCGERHPGVRRVKFRVSGAAGGPD